MKDKGFRSVDRTSGSGSSRRAAARLEEAVDRRATRTDQRPLVVHESHAFDGGEEDSEPVSASSSRAPWAGRKNPPSSALP